MISIYILRKNDSGRIETADRIINSKFVPMLETELGPGITEALAQAGMRVVG